MKTTRTVYTKNLTYLVDVRTKTVSHNGLEVSREESEHVLRVLSARMKQAAARKEREEVLKSCGLVKVRGAVSGRIYWE